ncbi:hypothetical protein SARC_08293 [Sphaeroforma arctica JP610]|uniref:Uncharacterized protein n=1 Tax=Sphaeroforma arctica JP610 TaxID=667725 RepID=A0A0L0FRA7_9EUKA|nr:hypothetical protein SARC_08293 [Sphaeroforma arctica JP610]KNC79310.1 hypothetical protein SARC_08293 [Sphaeroforma arctica JP610]|eukprot:XP_014153212.1 hypothetical protein SARC_08293 [Sphaeroforma arctica JP610]
MREGSLSDKTPPLDMKRGEVVNYKKCRFQAFVCRGVRDESDVKTALAEIRSEKAVAKASHPHIYAYICPQGSMSDCNGERGAGRVWVDS